MKKIDQVDRQILQILHSDGRTPYTEIAQQLGLSEGTIRARITRLLQEGVFEFVIHTNPEKLDVHVQAIISLTTKLGMQKQVAQQLGEFSEVSFIGAFSGKHDLMIRAWFYDNEELITFVNERLSQIEGIVAAEVSVELKRYKDCLPFVRDDEVAIS